MRDANYFLAVLWCVSALLNSTTIVGFIAVAAATYHAYQATKRGV